MLIAKTACHPGRKLGLKDLLCATYLLKGRVEMATKSVLKNIMIKDRRSASFLVSALENASGKKSKDVVLSRTYSELGRDEIRNIFGEKDYRVQSGKSN